MTALLGRPSFWAEPRDPYAWQRALRRVEELGGVPDPRPAWEGPLRDLAPRRSVTGLYGLKTTPRPGALLGVGLLEKIGERWCVHPDARPLTTANREEFQDRLARWLVARSPWVRLALGRLSTRVWTLPRGTGPLHGARALRVGDDFDIGAERVRLTMTRDDSGVGRPLHVDAGARTLSALHAPLYLLHAIGWLDAAGMPTLPQGLGTGVLRDSPAELLRRVCEAAADVRGFVAVERAARGLWAATHGKDVPTNLAAWADEVFGGAIERGTIEVHDWAPGQPRHGRGLRGERDRKLVQWTIHDDFELDGGRS
jgi:hypothetical protein